MVRTKVFVGNLSFKTQESDLAKEFEVAGKVATANIISRGSRSLGYGFVELESEEEARKAVELLHKKQIDGREIKVEVAKPRDENATKEGAAPRAPRQRAPRPAGNNANGGAAAEGEAQGEGAAPRRRRPGVRRPRRRPQNADGTPAAAGEGQKEGGAPRAPRTRGPPRQPKAEGERAPKTAAPNTLFVANLPFSVDDEGLSKIFAGLNLKTAHVVRKRNNRSKGFGFVEFNSEEDQKKALAAVDKKTVENRELIVKVALTEIAAPAPAAGEAAAAPKKDAAPASPKPATAN